LSGVPYLRLNNLYELFSLPHNEFVLHPSLCPNQQPVGNYPHRISLADLHDVAQEDFCRHLLQVESVRLEHNTATCDLQSPAHGLNAAKEIRSYIRENFLALTDTARTAIEHASAMFALDRNRKDFFRAEWACLRFPIHRDSSQPNTPL
jgi:hypothetical protein